MGGIGEGIDALFKTLGCLLFLGLPGCIGIGVLIGWFIWG